jgi:hypothetical protein
MDGSSSEAVPRVTLEVAVLVACDLDVALGRAVASTSLRQISHKYRAVDSLIHSLYTTQVRVLLADTRELP